MRHLRHPSLCVTSLMNVSLTVKLNFEQLTFDFDGPDTRSSSKIIFYPAHHLFVMVVPAKIQNYILECYRQDRAGKQSFC